MMLVLLYALLVNESPITRRNIYSTPIRSKRVFCYDCAEIRCITITKNTLRNVTVAKLVGFEKRASSE
jgi:hypothetical protein